MDNDTAPHYRYMYKGVKLDPARIMMVYGINHPMANCIIKKALCAGQRGPKSAIEDIKDIICAAERWLEMIDEDREKVSETDLQAQSVGGAIRYE